MTTKRLALDPATAQAIAEALEAALLAAEPRLERATKWHRPTYTVNGNWHHWICAVQQSGGAVHLWFHKGALLDDPTGALQQSGSSRYLRRLTYRRPEEVDREVIARIVAEAVRKQRAMLD